MYKFFLQKKKISLQIIRFRVSCFVIEKRSIKLKVRNIGVLTVISALTKENV